MNVDLIIESKWIAPIIPEQSLLTDYAVVIKDKKIVALCPQKDLASQYAASKSIQLSEHILMPGLINAHGHAPMTLLRGMADDMPLDLSLIHI